MTSVVIIADNGAEMARLTAVVTPVGMALVRHASGRALAGASSPTTSRR